MSESPAERRRFRRTEGVLNFTLRRIVDRMSVGLRHEENGPLRLVHVMLKNFSAYVNYRSPADADIFQQQIRIMEELLLELEQESERKERELIYCHQPAIISGDALEFATSLQFAVGDRVELHLCFPIYPFTSVVVQTHVIKVKPHGTLAGDKRVVLKYDNISVDDQEQITKYVASRERELIRQKRLGNMHDQ